MIGWLIGGLVVILLACLLAGIFLPKSLKYTFASKNIFSEPYDKIKEGHFYKGKTFYLYDWFAENNEGRFYLAPVTDSNGEDGFIEVYIPNQFQDKANRIMNQTWEYMESGDKDDLKEYISINGYVKYMDDKSVEFLNQYCDQVGMTKAERSTISNKMFVMVLPSQVYNVDFVGNLIFPTLLALAGIYFIIHGINGRYMRFLKKKMKENNISSKDIDEDLGNAPKVGNALIGTKYILMTAGAPKLYRIEDIVWVYPQRVSQINAPTAYYATMFTRFHENIRIQVKDDPAAESVCGQIRKSQPRALYGYNIENTTAYFNNFNALIDSIYNQPEAQPQVQPADDQNVTPIQ